MRVDQLQQVTYDSSGEQLSEIAVELYHIRYRPTSADDDADLETGVVSDVATYNDDGSDEQTAAAQAVPIHKTILSTDWLLYSLTNRGGLSAKDGLMCWSTVDRVLCGRLTSSGSVSDIRTVLPHDAFAGSICRGTYTCSRSISKYRRSSALSECRPIYIQLQLGI